MQITDLSTLDVAALTVGMTGVLLIAGPRLTSTRRLARAFRRPAPTPPAPLRVVKEDAA